MEDIITIGVDLAKSVFQLHGVDAAGKPVLRRQFRRNQMLSFFQHLPPCLIGMEACAGAHCWARQLSSSGHEVRLMPPSYVKPYVKRGKTDQADAAAIAEAVTRPDMRFVPVKSEETQAALLTHKAREFLVRQLTGISNAIRAHPGEFGIVAPKGVHNIGRLLEAAGQADLPDCARGPVRLLAEQFAQTQSRIDELTAAIRRKAETDETPKRLQTIPGIGPITASALAATLPDVTGFQTSRDLSAWLGLTPKPHSSGGRERLSRIPKMGNRYLRRLLYLGAMGVITARRRHPAGDDWLWKIMGRKKPKQVAVALANRMARTVWALIRNGTEYQRALAG